MDEPDSPTKLSAADLNPASQEDVQPAD